MTFEMPRVLVVLVLPLAICGCSSEKKAAATSGAASGEVLPGSASDAMLPLDTVRSQPPMAEASEDRDNGSDKPDAKPSQSASSEKAAQSAEEAPERVADSPPDVVMPDEE